MFNFCIAISIYPLPKTNLCAEIVLPLITWPSEYWTRTEVRSSMMCVLVRVSIPAQTSWPRSSWGGKGLFGLHFHTAVHHQRKSGLELKQVRKQELMQRPWSSLLACSACSLIEPRLPAQRWSHPQGALPPWSLIEKMPSSWISWRHFPQLKLLSLW